MKFYFLIILYFLPFYCLAENATTITDIASDKITSLTKDNPDMIKHIITVVGMLVTLIGGFFIARITTKAARSNVKLEQLKLIYALSVEKNVTKGNYEFLVEEAFRSYFGKHIPIKVINILTALEEQFSAFSCYEVIGGLTSYNDKTKKIKSLSTRGIQVRIAALIAIAVFFILLAVFFGVILYKLLKEFTDITLVFLLIVTVVGVITSLSLIASGYLVNLAFDTKPYFNRFEKALADKIETTELPRSNIIVLVIFSIFIGGIICTTRHLF